MENCNILKWGEKNAAQFLFSTFYHIDITIRWKYYKVFSMLPTPISQYMEYFPLYKANIRKISHLLQIMPKLRKNNYENCVIFRCWFLSSI